MWLRVELKVYHPQPPSLGIPCTGDTVNMADFCQNYISQAFLNREKKNSRLEQTMPQIDITHI